MIQRGSLATIKSSESIPPDAEQDNRGMVIDQGSPSQHNRVRFVDALELLAAILTVRACRDAAQKPKVRTTRKELPSAKYLRSKTAGPTRGAAHMP